MLRLDALVARNLGISKTAATRLIEAGRVRDQQGAVYSDRKTPIDPATLPRTVFVGDDPVALFDSAFVLLHKPIGVVTALRDERHPTAYALLRDAPLFAELRPVGRLDLESSGLLLWTTDGALIQRLTHPKRRVPRTYQAALARPFQALPDDFVLADGLRPQILELRAIAAHEAHPALARPDGVPELATVTIIGGAYHEVRRLFAALGSHVLALCRTRFGPYDLPIDLAPGIWRQQTPIS